MTRCKTSVTRMALAAAALSAVAFAASGPALAQTTMPESSGTSATAGKTGSLNPTDRHFAMEAAKGGMAEVALGRLAQQKGGSDAVKQFGARMVEDHGKANDELKQLAMAKGLTLPSEPPEDAKAKKLETLSGNDFDHAYMNEMLAGHKKTVALFQKEANSASGDADLKAFARKTLPTIQAHLRMLEDDLHAKAGSGAAMTN